MQDLKVIGVEDGALLAANVNGERFRIAIDEVLKSRLRQNKPEVRSGPKVSPREVQAHIRSGMTAEEVSTLTGADLEYVLRFEGPIMAEREHIVSSALSVHVNTHAEEELSGEPATFGSVIRERLGSLTATGERWASWKEHDGGWIVKLAFTADEIDHDARWGYDPRKHSLTPKNSEATTLSQQGELPGGLIPRLRAVSPGESQPDESRFDSGAFNFVDDFQHDNVHRSTPQEPLTFGRTISSSNNSIAVTAIKRAADDGAKDQHQTADLLEALRRRRGERESVSAEEHASDAIDVPLDDFDTLEEKPAPARSAASTQRSQSGKKRRTSMPSWDEIVFGARTDDDLA